MASGYSQVRNGKAFEYAIATQYHSYILNNGRKADIIENDALTVARKYFNELSEKEQDGFNKAAFNTIATMVKIEPGLTVQKNENDVLRISLNDDSAGESGDVRDVIFQRGKPIWEIGFSAKNNNDAVKHSRLGWNLDFGKVWLGIPCSDNYWNEIKGVFDFLEDCIEKKYSWNDLGTVKRDKVYIPLLSAFKKEVLDINANNPDVPGKLVEYLVGSHPFYKIIKDDAHNLVIVKAFNIKGELNKPYNNIKSEYSTPKINLPRRIVEFEFKDNSDTTLNMILDGGWEISFRLHNASTMIERSLKFDIKLLGNPPVLFTQYIFQ